MYMPAHNNDTFNLISIESVKYMYCETIPGLHVHVRMINWRIKSDRS